MKKRSAKPFGRPLWLFFFVSLVTSHQSLVTVFAAQRPSLFRGVVVADSQAGVRVVEVEETSQAAVSDLRPEDIIVQINDVRVQSIDEFAAVSSTLRGHATKAMVLILRNNQPIELVVHLYSVGILREWDLTFIPDYEFQFREPKAGVEYWTRMGRGYEVAGHTHEALQAYLNALHNDPSNVPVAMRVSDLLWRIAQDHLNAERLPDALMALQQGTRILNRLFDHPLEPEQVETIKSNLEQVLALLRKFRSKT